MGMDNQLRLSSESDAYMLAQAPPLTEGGRRGKGEWQEWIMGIDNCVQWNDLREI